MDREKVQRSIFKLNSLERFLKEKYLQDGDYYREEPPEEARVFNDPKSKSIIFEGPDAPTEGGRMSERVFMREDDVILFKHPRYYAPFTHSHSFIEMCYVMSGCGLNEVDEQEFEFRQGDLCIISPQVVHKLSVNTDSVLINILVRKSTIFDSLISVMKNVNPLSAYFSNILYGNPYPMAILLHTGGGERLENMILDMYAQQMQTEATGDISYHRDIMNGLLHSFVGIAMQQSGERIEISEKYFVQEDRYSKIVDYIEKHCVETDLKECAQKFFLNERYLSNALKKYTGKSFSTLRQEALMHRASELLKNSTQSIENISRSLGYEYATHFMRSFKKQMGCTPTEYRRTNGI